MGGFFGNISKTDCVRDLFYGTDYHSHLGTKRGGMAVLSPDGFTRKIHNIEADYFRAKFEPDLGSFSGNSGIGIISDFDAQPLIIKSHLGEFGIVTVGKISNLTELEDRAFKSHQHFSETGGKGTSPTELAAMLISEGKTFEEGLVNLQSLIKGSCSVLLLTDQGIYAARDKLGRTPVVLGRKGGAFAAASESSSFHNLGYSIERDLGPGEIVLMTADGCEQKAKPGDKMQICSFLWVYYGYPSSNYQGINVEQCRYKCGAFLARDDDAKIDYVAGIPDSGVGYAIGYSNGKQIPYMRPLVKYTPTWPRSFMPQNQSTRNLVAKMKLIPNQQIIKDKSIAFCEDSIVRGTQLQDNVQVIYDFGAREVHMRVACATLL
ncbi:MAG: amidophosphoribosyltransferase, partial [Candidatus Edwardsbacteria bacterium]|nr:amidophosphoribosyltransferase [Candidatus Edwardsbacteria bacterium]MBU1575575.1 amidophosphoribosyltransferase [Candidatus Edwardsbacteria bacterium]MBU2463597.1 amidophosphoribosyltransferase [Candidatus Edwardsbacteria bacterium]